MSTTAINLPQNRGNIDWDKIVKDYHDLILSPFSSCMINPDPDTGQVRNNLVESLLSIDPEEISKMDIADFGCGPGNLMKAVGPKIPMLYGIDSSREALALATEEADKHSVDFCAIRADLRHLSINMKFDIIISVNSILPPSRSDVLKILNKIREHLKPGGKLMAIMPSYDTTLYLQDLVYDDYLEKYKDEEKAQRHVDKFRLRHLVDDNNLQYADDEKNIQCYHNPDSICTEIAEAGLYLVKPPRKVYYPWGLTGQFDYGYFPGAPEEIWDWYIEACLAT